MNSEPLEKWISCPYQDFPYEVSDLGRVRRLSIASERVRKIHPKRNYGPKIMRSIINNGYHYVTLCGPNKNYIRVGIHRLVLEAFVGPQPPSMYGCHNDGNKGNNRISNLRWDTPKANQQDRVRHGNDQCGENNGSAVMTKEKAEAMREHRQRFGTTYKELGKIFGVNVGTAHNALTKKTKFLV